MEKPDRRVRRTRELLQKAMTELVRERRYSAITIQDIVDRANVGRTTFYLHYGSKDDLFISCHESIVHEFQLGPFYPLTREELLSTEPPPGLTSAFGHLAAARHRLYAVFQGKDSPQILRRMRERWALEIEAHLAVAFAPAKATIPLDVLANHLAGAQIALVQWWMEDHQPHAPEKVAGAFHRLQRAAIHEVFGLEEGEGE